MAQWVWLTQAAPVAKDGIAVVALLAKGRLSDAIAAQHIERG
jgi:hypothetical protein